MSRILLIQLKRIGDGILTTPVLSALRQSDPGAKLILAIDSSAAGLAYGIDADEVLVHQRGWRGWTFANQIRQNGPYDVVLDFTGNDRSAWLTACSGGVRRITYARFAAKPLRKRIYTDFVDSSVRDQHTVDHHLDLLQSVGIDVQGVPPYLQIPGPSSERAAALLESKGVREPFAVIHPGSARSEKFWTDSGWQDVARHLVARGFTVVFTGSAAEEERAHIARIRAGAEVATVDLSGVLSLMESAAIFQSSALVCAVDSAPVHLCDALGTPVVALFGPTNPHHWRPRGTRSRVVRPWNSDPDGPRSRGGMMTDIPAASVIAAIDSL